MLSYVRIIIILCLISSLARFVLDSYLPSLPAISQNFGISDESTQLTLTLYLLGFSLSQLVYGPLSDRYGRRLIILIGLCILIVGNMACAISNSHSILLLARLIAGVGAGSCGVLNRAIASDCFKGAEFSKAWSYTTTALVITLSVAPVLGGYIQELGGWRANFILATFFVGIVLLVVFKFLPETHPQKLRQVAGNSLGMRKVFQDYASIFTSTPFIMGALCYTLAFSGLIAYFQVSPLLFINTLGLTPSQYGWCSLVIAAHYLVGGLIVTKFAGRVGTDYLLRIGTLLLILGGLLMLLAYLYDYLTVAAVLIPASIYVVGARIVIPNAIANSMEKVRHLNGSSSALIGCIQMLGSSLISLLIANFSNTTSLPLSLVLIATGFITLCLVLTIIKYDLTLPKKFLKAAKKSYLLFLREHWQLLRNAVILLALCFNLHLFTLLQVNPYFYCMSEWFFHLFTYHVYC